MSWSGGKDSTYTLWLLTEVYGLRMLAFTFDNGFVSPTAMDNMRTVGERLGVDHVIVKPRFALSSASSLPTRWRLASIPRGRLGALAASATPVWAWRKGMGVRLALEYDVSMLVYGWSPG